jgi:hypothetical protein
LNFYYNITNLDKVSTENFLQKIFPEIIESGMVSVNKIANLAETLDIQVIHELRENLIIDDINDFFFSKRSLLIENGKQPKELVYQQMNSNTNSKAILMFIINHYANVINQ